MCTKIMFSTLSYKHIPFFFFKLKQKTFQLLANCCHVRVIQCQLSLHVPYFSTGLGLHMA